MHTDEEGYVFAVRKNALQILLPRYGLETTLFLRDKEGRSIGEFNEEVFSIGGFSSRKMFCFRKRHRRLTISLFVCLIR